MCLACKSRKKLLKEIETQKERKKRLQDGRQRDRKKGGRKTENDRPQIKA